MSSLQRQIEVLETKREKLNTQIKSLIEKRNQQLLSILNSEHNSTIDPDIIVGGLLYVCENTSNPNLAKQWREIGQKFCRSKSKSQPKALPKAA